MNPQTNYFAQPQRPGQAPPQTTTQQLTGQRRAMQAVNPMPTNVTGAAVAPGSNPLPTPESAPAMPPAPATSGTPNVPGAVATPPAPQAIGSAVAAPAPKVIENPISTQATLMISELRDGIVIMKDGSFRAVVACQSINFDLMSQSEREGVEYSYQNFLNSLNFTIQILARSQRVDIGPYIDRLINIRRNSDNMLLGVLMDDYINFIETLAQEANIMDKSFFIVIPYYSSADAEKLVTQTKNLFRGFSKKPPEVTRINRDTYNKAIDELNNRVESVVSGLFQIGIQSVRLNTRELSELFYNFNNPDTAVREPLVDFSQLATTYVRKGEKPHGQA